MRQPFVAGNWKMNGSRDSVAALIQGIRQELNKVKQAEVAVCPSYVFLSEISVLIEGSDIRLGAQDISCYEKGAYTGEISAAMLMEYGCQYVIIGHSERRQYHQESNELIANKCIAAQKAGLTPILCVGETESQREENITTTIITQQLQAVFKAVGEDNLSNMVIAYEPVWAIGTGKTASPEQAQEVHHFIRQYIGQYNQAIANKMRIIYGGSVKPNNAKELMAMTDIDGGLIGGASLKVEDFLAICEVA